MVDTVKIDEAHLYANRKRKAYKEDLEDPKDEESGTSTTG